jgi:hypothetical protein
MVVVFPHGRKRGEGMRRFVAILLTALAVAANAGCRFSIGNRRLTVKPGVEIPARSFETGDGETIVHERMTPKGRSVLVFVGGELEDLPRPVERVSVLKKFNIKETEEVR